MEVRPHLTLKDLRRVVGLTGSTLLLAAGCTQAGNVPAPSAAERAKTPAVAPTARVETPKATLIYHGSLLQIEGKPLLSAGELKPIIDSLREIDLPFLTKLTNDVEKLATDSKKSPELPSWIGNDSFPLVITKDNSRKSMNPARDYRDSREFLFSTDRVTRNPFLNRMIFGIHLGVPDHLKALGSHAEGIFLLKEHLNNMVLTRLALDSYRQINLFQLGKFSDLNGSALTNSEDQIKAGASIVLANMGDPKTQIWQIVDGLPILLMSRSIDQLILDGYLPYTTDALAELYVADNLLEKYPDVVAFLDRMIERWHTDNTLLPPSELTDQAFSGELLNVIIALNKQLNILTPDRAK